MTEATVESTAGQDEIIKQNSELAQEILTVIRGVLKRDDIGFEMSFANDLKLDSLDQAELMMELEEKFGVSIEDKAIERISTVEDAIRETISMTLRKDSAG